MSSIETKRKILEACKSSIPSLENALPQILPMDLSKAAHELFDAGYIDADFGEKTYIHGSESIANVRITPKGVHYLDSLNAFFNSSAS